MQAPAFRTDSVVRNASALATRVAETHANNLKIALTRARAIATGKTINSVRMQFVLDSPARGEFRRAVTARDTWFYIMVGRRAGGKLPVHVVGTDAKGKPMFEPLPALQEWFQALGIPRPRWFPILWAIKRRGVKPRDIQKRMMRESRPRMFTLVAFYTEQIAKDLFGGTGGATVSKFARNVTP